MPRRRAQAQAQDQSQPQQSDDDSAAAANAAADVVTSSIPKLDRPLRVAFLHPNLGIGGAERLVVDCASALRQKGHTVHFFTNYHDPTHCYAETIDGTLPVSVYGQTRDSLFGRFHVVVAVVRMLYLSLIFALWHARRFDVVFIDQIAHAVPVLRWTTRCKLLFYCHFPDALLSQPGGTLKRLYRAPIDRAEEWAAARAHILLVNSRFTLDTVERTWPSMRARVARGDVHVLYPSIDFARYTRVESSAEVAPEQRGEVELLEELIYGPPSAAASAAPSASPPRREPIRRLLVSINRFERKKHLRLAIDAFSLLALEAHKAERARKEELNALQAREGFDAARAKVQSSPPPPPLPVSLMMTGGFDPANRENREHFEELLQLCAAMQLRAVLLDNVRDAATGRTVLRLADRSQSHLIEGGPPALPLSRLPLVFFLRSFTDVQRSFLLSHALAVLYTPSNEHFGIVPVEAQFMCRPVVAVDSGGPLESVRALDIGAAGSFTTAGGPSYNGEDEEKVQAGEASGMLCPPEPRVWFRALKVLLAAEERARVARLEYAASLSRGGGASSLPPPPPSLAEQLGQNGKRNVLAKFHFRAFQAQLIEHIAALVEGRPQRRQEL